MTTTDRKRVKKCREFSEGDKVIIARSFKNSTNLDLWDPFMNELIGSKATISGIDFTDGTVRLNFADKTTLFNWWSPFSLDKVTIDKKELYQKLQDVWVKLNNIKIGSTVKVTGSAASYENGWTNGWESCMLSEGTLVIDNICKDSSGIRMKGGFRYPYFILEPVIDDPDTVHVITTAGKVIISKNSEYVINERKFTFNEGEAIRDIIDSIDYRTVRALNPHFEINGWRFNYYDCEAMNSAYKKLNEKK